MIEGVLFFRLLKKLLLVRIEWRLLMLLLFLNHDCLWKVVLLWRFLLFDLLEFESVSRLSMVEVEI